MCSLFCFRSINSNKDLIQIGTIECLDKNETFLLQISRQDKSGDYRFFTLYWHLKTLFNLAKIKLLQQITISRIIIKSMHSNNNTFVSKV